MLRFLAATPFCKRFAIRGSHSRNDSLARRFAAWSERMQRAGQRCSGLAVALSPGRGYVIDNPNCPSLALVLGYACDAVCDAHMEDEFGDGVRVTSAAKRAGVVVVSAGVEGAHRERQRQIRWILFGLEAARRYATPRDQMRGPPVTALFPPALLSFVLDGPEERGRGGRPAVVHARLLEGAPLVPVARELNDDERWAQASFYLRSRVREADGSTSLTISCRHLGGGHDDARLVLVSESRGGSSRWATGRRAAALAQFLRPLTADEARAVISRAAKAESVAGEALREFRAGDLRVMDLSESLYVLARTGTQGVYRDLAAALKRPCGARSTCARTSSGSSSRRSSRHRASAARGKGLLEFELGVARALGLRTQSTGVVANILPRRASRKVREPFGSISARRSRFRHREDVRTKRVDALDGDASSTAASRTHTNHDILDNAQRALEHSWSQRSNRTIVFRDSPRRLACLEKAWREKTCCCAPVASRAAVFSSLRQYPSTSGLARALDAARDARDGAHKRQQRLNALDPSKCNPCATLL